MGKTGLCWLLVWTHKKKKWVLVLAGKICGSVYAWGSIMSSAWAYPKAQRWWVYNSSTGVPFMYLCVKTCTVVNKSGQELWCKANQKERERGKI